MIFLNNTDEQRIYHMSQEPGSLIKIFILSQHIYLNINIRAEKKKYYIFRYIIDKLNSLVYIYHKEAGGR